MPWTSCGSSDSVDSSRDMVNNRKDISKGAQSCIFTLQYVEVCQADLIRVYVLTGCGRVLSGVASISGVCLKGAMLEASNL